MAWRAVWTAALLAILSHRRSLAEQTADQIAWEPWNTKADQLLLNESNENYGVKYCRELMGAHKRRTSPDQEQCEQCTFCDWVPTEGDFCAGRKRPDTEFGNAPVIVTASSKYEDDHLIVALKVNHGYEVSTIEFPGTIDIGVSYQRGQGPCPNGPLQGTWSQDERGESVCDAKNWPASTVDDCNWARCSGADKNPKDCSDLWVGRFSWFDLCHPSIGNTKESEGCRQSDGQWALQFETGGEDGTVHHLQDRRFDNRGEPAFDNKGEGTPAAFLYRGSIQLLAKESLPPTVENFFRPQVDPEKNSSAETGAMRRTYNWQLPYYLGFPSEVLVTAELTSDLAEASFVYDFIFTMKTITPPERGPGAEDRNGKASPTGVVIEFETQVRRPWRFMANKDSYSFAVIGAHPNGELAGDHNDIEIKKQELKLLDSDGEYKERGQHCAGDDEFTEIAKRGRGNDEDTYSHELHKTICQQKWQLTFELDKKSGGWLCNPNAEYKVTLPLFDKNHETTTETVDFPFQLATPSLCPKLVGFARVVAAIEGWNSRDDRQNGEESITNFNAWDMGYFRVTASSAMLGYSHIKRINVIQISVKQGEKQRSLKAPVVIWAREQDEKTINSGPDAGEKYKEAFNNEPNENIQIGGGVKGIGEFLGADVTEEQTQCAAGSDGCYADFQFQLKPGNAKGWCYALNGLQTAACDHDTKADCNAEQDRDGQKACEWSDTWIWSSEQGRVSTIAVKLLVVYDSGDGNRRMLIETGMPMNGLDTTTATTEIKVFSAPAPLLSAANFREWGQKLLLSAIPCLLVLVVVLFLRLRSLKAMQSPGPQDKL